MDELIRELETRAIYAREVRDYHVEGSRLWIQADEAANTWDRAANLAHEAKRRMAEQAPAWDLA